MPCGSQTAIYEHLDIAGYNNRSKLEMCLGDALAGLGREATSDRELMKELREDFIRNMIQMLPGKMEQFERKV